MDSYKIIDISFILLAALLDLEPRYQLLSQLALSRAASYSRPIFMHDGYRTTLSNRHPLVNGLFMQL